MLAKTLAFSVKILMSNSKTGVVVDLFYKLSVGMVTYGPTIILSQDIDEQFKDRCRA